MSDNRGRSCLGLCHPRFDVKGLIKSFDGATEIRAGWLDHFFNEKDSKNAATLCSLPHKKFIRVHIINGPGMNNNRTLPHEITFRETHESLCKKIADNDPVFMKKFRARLEAVKKCTDKAPAGTLELAISPWLERQEVSSEVFGKLANEIRAVFPNAHIVDNPRDVSVPFIIGQMVMRERHGDVPNPTLLDIVDMDGTDFEMVDIPKFMHRYENCRAVMLWGLGENGNWAADTWKPPSKRTGWTSSRENPIYKAFVQPFAEMATLPNPVDLARIKKRLNPHDGFKKDFIWKIGEWKKTAVAVFPRRFKSRFKTVEIYKEGKRVDKLKFRAILNDGSGRLIYDSTLHPTKVRKGSVLVADGNGWVLDYPAYRID
jgi:hypothetical protein